MASKTRRTEITRKKKLATKGRRRKSVARTKGSTRTAKELFGDK